MKQIKALVGLVVLFSLIYVGWRVLPVYYTHYELEDFIESQARLDSYSQRTESEIAETIAQKAKELDLPVTLDQVKVQKAPGAVVISTEYTVHVDLPIRPLDLNMKAETKNKRI